MSIKTKQKSKVWVVYILRCADDSLYTGATNNIGKRLAAHNEGKAAKYTRSRRPVKLLITSAKMERSDALHLEINIKKMPRAKKIAGLEKYAGRGWKKTKAGIGLPSPVRKTLRRKGCVETEKMMKYLIIND